MHKFFLALAIPALVLAGQAEAQQPSAPAPPVRDDNFAFAPAEGRHLKIDRRNGRVSLCEEGAGEWRCRLIPDDRDAYEEDVARLQKERDDLRRQLAELRQKTADADRDGAWIDEKDEKNFEKFMDFTDRAFRRFFGMVEDLRREYETPDRI